MPEEIKGDNLGRENNTFKGAVSTSESPVWLTAVTPGPSTEYVFNKYLQNDWCV